MEVLKLDVWYNGDYGMSFFSYGTELNPIGSYIGHSWKTFRLIPTVRPFFVPPKIKESDSSSAYINGKNSNLNSLLGFPLFDNREGTFTFYIDFTSLYVEPEINYTTNYVTGYITGETAANRIQTNDGFLNGAGKGSKVSATKMTSRSFPEYISKIHKCLHGKHVAIILDEDPNYFYDAYIQVESDTASNDGSLNGVTIAYSAYPYKISVNNSVSILEPTASNQRRFDTYFNVGQMPIAPYLKVESIENTNVAHDHKWHYRIGFENPEIPGMIQYAPSEGNYNLIVNDVKDVIKLFAAYKKASSQYSRSRKSFICSDYYGDNTCHFWMYDTHQNLDLDQVTKRAEILFRKGYL